MNSGYLMKQLIPGLTAGLMLVSVAQAGEPAAAPAQAH